MEVTQCLPRRFTRVDTQVERYVGVVPGHLGQQGSQVRLPSTRQQHDVGDVLLGDDEVATLDGRELRQSQVGDGCLHDDLHFAVFWAEWAIGVRNLRHSVSLLSNTGIRIVQYYITLFIINQFCGAQLLIN